MLLITLIVISQPDGDSLEAKVSKILEPIRREERNEKGIYQLAARLDDMPEPLPKLGRWIRDEDDRLEDRDVTEELLLLGDEAGPIVMRLLADDRSPAVRAGLCDVVIQFESIDPLPVLTNLIATDPEALVRGEAVSAAVEYDADRAAAVLLRAVAAESDYSVLDAVIRALPKLGPERALGPLLAELNSADVNASYHRAMAADALGELGGEEAIAALWQTVDAKDDTLSMASLRALANLRDRESLSRLIARIEAQVTAFSTALLTNATSSRYTPIYLDAEVVRSLGEFGDPSAVPVLLQALELSPTHWPGEPVVEALGKIGDERALDPLVDSLKRSVDRLSRKPVIDAIAGITSSNTFPALLGIMTNHTDSAGDVVEAMSRLRGAQATEQLREILNHSTRRARGAAAQALGMSGDSAALPVLLEAIDSNDDEARKAAAEALGMIADPKAIPALITALKDSSSDVRQEAAWAMGRIGDPVGAPALIAALADAEFAVRFAAAFALAGIQDASAVAPLQPLLKDKERRVQIAAACSLAFHNSDAGFETLKSNLRSRSEDWHRFAAIVGLLRLNTPAAREVLEQAPADLKYPQLQRLREVGLKDGPSPALMSLLREGTDEQRHYAARVLPFFRDPATVAPLREAANDASAEVRSAARVGAVQVERQLAARHTNAP